MKVLSLYCGAGGIDEGLRQAGIKTTLAIDNCKEFSGSDPLNTMKINHDCEVLCANVGDVKESFGYFDIVVGGPPCPEFSRAKTGRNMDPCEVNHFWDIVESTKCKYHMMENVQDVIKVIPNKKNYLVNCADYGVPQTRIRRIFTNLSLPKPTHSEFPTNTLFGEPMKKWVSVKEALGLDGIIEFFISVDGYAKCNQIEKTRSIDNPSQTVLTGRDLQITDYKIKSLKNIRNKTMLEKHPPTEMKLTSNTITTKDRGWIGDSIVSDGVYCRKLENEELAVLQGFPNNYKFFGNKGSVRRQIGNAVPPPLIRAFAKELMIIQ